MRTISGFLARANKKWSTSVLSKQGRGGSKFYNDAQHCEEGSEVEIERDGGYLMDDIEKLAGTPHSGNHL